MIEIGFAIVLGFAIASTLCGLIADHSRADRIMMRALVYIIVLSLCVGATQGRGLIGQTQYRVILSFAVHYAWLTLGALLAIRAQIVAEGYLHKLWVKFHPQSAPSAEVGFGQRARPVSIKRPVAATLMGTSTEYLKDGLDLRTDTLIRLCFYAFEDRSALTLSRIESGLRLGTGRRQKAFHKIAAELRRRPNLQSILHRYSRSINGSSRLSQTIFAELCHLARDTNNMDSSTRSRLKQTATGLGLTADMTTRLMSGSR